MSNHKKSKKIIDRLHEVLDNDSKSSKNSKDGDKDYLESLSNRLAKSKEEKMKYQKSTQKSSDNNMSLQPKVTVHPRTEKQFKEVKIKVEISKTEQPEGEKLPEGEDLFEIEKTETVKPEFIEVKPKTSEKKEVEEKEEKKTETEEQLTEWEPVEFENTPEKKETGKKPEEKEKLKEKDENGEKTQDLSKKEENDTVEAHPVKSETKKPGLEKDIEEKKGEQEFNQNTTETNKKTAEIETVEVEPSIDETEKEKEETVKLLSKEFESIDRDTALLLFENGYINSDTLEDSTYKDLKKIKGLKRRKAKKITKEINKRIQEKVNIKPIEVSETAEGVVAEEEIEQKDFLEEKEQKSSPMELSDEQNHWKQVKEDFTEEKESEQVVPEEKIQEKIMKQDKIKPYEKINSIDEQVAILLFNNGYKSIDELKNADYKDLKKIRGINKKTAKKIVQELKDLDKNSEWEIMDSDTELETSIEKTEGKEGLISNQEKIDLFKEIENIDENTALILYDNGFKSIDDIRTASVEDICKTKMIPKRKAKQIKKEINKKFFSEGEKKSDKEFAEFLTEENIDEDSEKIDEKIKNYVKSEGNIEEEFFIEEKEESINENESTFKDIKSINDKIEKLLLKNGIDSIEKLKDKRIKDLTKIKGIRRKIAKKIKKEVKKISSEEKYDTLKENPYIEEEIPAEKDEWTHYDINENEGKEEKKQKICIHKKYTLYEKEIKTKKGNKRKIRFFSKKKPDDAKPIKLPKGYIIKENKKTGVPYLKKRK